ncbi:MAG: hypothetical protein IT369_09105 [Candidatus Latescibacteria bacterium]|nr:hypothetical protein [Candidatus Latescibacterota bacterium]
MDNRPSLPAGSREGWPEAAPAAPIPSRWLLGALAVGLFLNETAVHFAMALTVGQRGLGQAWTEAFAGFTLDRYLFFTLFRFFPYGMLALAVLRMARTPWRQAMRPVLLGGLAGIAGFLAWGIWEALLPIYTGPHPETTPAFALLFLSVAAVPAGAVGALAGYWTMLVRHARARHRRA